MKRSILNSRIGNMLRIILPTLLLICTLCTIPVSAASCGDVNTSIIECEEGGSGKVTISYSDKVTVGEYFKPNVTIKAANQTYSLVSKDNSIAKPFYNQVKCVSAGTTYECYSGWYAYRVWDLDQNVTLKGIN